MNRLMFKFKGCLSFTTTNKELLNIVEQAGCMVKIIRNLANKTKLEHIGVIDKCKLDVDYEIGQTFLHRVFAYRGIILYRWSAHIHERNRDVSNSVKPLDDTAVGKKYIPKLETYYQVIVDSRDSAQLSCHSSEIVTFLSNTRSGNRPLLHTIPGIDYVSHEDIIPYASCEVIPVHHELFEKFFENHNNKTLPQVTDTFNTWQKKNHVCLELTNVHRETTDHIRVTAIPFFLGADESHNRLQPSEYWWRYCIRIENLGGMNAHLRESYWRIITNGTVSTRRSLGILGREPTLNNDQPACQLACRPLSLPTSSGQMWGTFRLEKDDGEQFDVRIPAFSLDSRPPSEPDSSSIDE